MKHKRSFKLLLPFATALGVTFYAIPVLGESISFSTSWTFAGIQNDGDNAATDGFAVKMFDPAWGTLNTVHVDITNNVNLSDYFWVSNGGSGSYELFFNVATWGKTAPLNGQASGLPPDPLSPIVASVHDFNAVDSHDWQSFSDSEQYSSLQSSTTPYTGTGEFQFDGIEKIDLTIGSTTFYEFLLNASFTSAVTVTYNYTPASSSNSSNPVPIAIGSSSHTLPSPPPGGWSIITIPSSSEFDVQTGDSVAAQGVDNDGYVNQSGGNLTISGNFTQTTSYTPDGSGGFLQHGIYDLSGGNVSLGGFTGNGTLNITGPATVSITTLDHSGIINQSNGSLSVGNFTQTGTITFDGNGNAVSGGVYNLSGGNAIISSMNNGGAVNLTGGSLTVDNLNVTAGGTMTQTGGNLTFAYIDNAGNMTFSGGNVDNSVGNGAGGIFTTVESTGHITVTGGNIFLNDIDNYGTVTVSSGTLTTGSGDSTIIESGGTLNISGGNVNLRMEVWTGGTVNLSGGNLTDPYGDVEVLGGNLTQTGGTANLITFYSGSGSTSKSNGSMSISYVFINESGGTFAQSGGTFSSANTTNRGNITITGGTAALGNLTGTGTVTIGSDATVSVSTVNLKSNTTYGHITVNGTLTADTASATRRTPDIALVVGNLTMGTGGLVDLKNHDLIIHSGQSLSDVMALLSSAYDSGTWDGTR